MLSSRGLVGVLHQVEHSEASTGVVFDQVPEAGHKATSGSPVVVRIPAPTTTTTTTTTLPPTTTTRPLGVEPGYRCFRINQTLNVNDPDSVASMVAELTRQLDQAEISDRRAGSVLVFGVSAYADGTGSRNAQRFIDYVFPEIDLFATTAARNFYTDTGGINGGFRLDISLLATPDDPPLAAEDSERC